jgi:hypothetical protein
MGAAVGGGEYAISADETFVWKSDRHEVTLSLTSDGWMVRLMTTGPLAGPPTLEHQARHRDARLATFDLMGRVGKASNEEEMVRAGSHAVQWINAQQRARSTAHLNGAR